MTHFVYLNTCLQKNAVNKFQENLHELIANSKFGKTLKSKLGRKKLKTLNNEMEIHQKTPLITIKNFQIQRSISHN